MFKIIDNTKLNHLSLRNYRSITNRSLDIIEETAMKSKLTSITLEGTSLQSQEIRRIDAALSIPFNDRDIPIKSNTKSAAKITR